MTRLLRLFRNDEAGSNAIEYGLVLAFVAVAIIMSISKVETPLKGIINGWGKHADTDSKPPTNVNAALAFQNLTQSDIKQLYNKYEGQDQMNGIGMMEWTSVYQAVTGTQPTKTSVLTTFAATDGAKGKGGNDDGVLTYSEFKAATLYNSYELK